MNPDVLLWGCLVLAYLAGVGTIPTIGLFRYREPVSLFPPYKPEPAEPAPAPSDESPKREPRHAAPITSHHGYDTMDVLAAGWEAAQEHHDQMPSVGFTMRVCGAIPSGTNEAAGWRCVKPAGHPYMHETAEGAAWAPVGGADGTWTPDPYGYPYPVPDQLPAGGSA